jgi:RNA polymerase sigma-70 factor (ECF subfamily)
LPLEDNDAPGLAGPEAGGRDIERALATLVEDQRTALLLVVLEGLTYREVAEVQGAPIGTVMSRLARARVQIKTFIDTPCGHQLHSVQSLVLKKLVHPN